MLQLMDRENISDIVEEYYDEYEAAYKQIMQEDDFKDICSIDNGTF